MAEDPEISRDDPEIDEACRLLRRVPARSVTDGRPDSDNFRHTDDSVSGWSCTLWQAHQDLVDIRAGHEDYGVVRICAQDIRARGLTIARRPLEGNDNHCEVFGDMSKKAVSRYLKQSAVWVVYPPSLNEGMPEKV